MPCIPAGIAGWRIRCAGDSSKPDRGYDIARLSRDVLQVMDTFAIDSAILVGHSIGGEELNYPGTHHAERVAGLVYLDALLQGLQAPDYRAIRAPALALYAVPGSAEALMADWYDRDDPAVQAAVQELFEMDRSSKLAEIARFDNEVPDSEVLVLENANHWIFVSHPDEVLVAIRRFVERNTVGR